MEFDKAIDTSGLNCPLPILKAKKALAELQSGQVLKVVATDPNSLRDFQAFAKQTGNALLEQISEGAAQGEDETAGQTTSITITHFLRRR